MHDATPTHGRPVDELPRARGETLVRVVFGHTVLERSHLDARASVEVSPPRHGQGPLDRVVAQALPMRAYNRIRFEGGSAWLHFGWL